MNNPAYQPIPWDPTELLRRKTFTLLKESGLPPEICKGLLPQAAVPPRLYGLPKIHQKGIPLRPIVSTINSPTYLLAKYLPKLLAPFVGQNQHHIQNSTEFVRKLTQIKMELDDIIVSFDVGSLFTKIPVKETLNFLETHFNKGINNLFRQTLTTTYTKRESNRNENLALFEIFLPLLCLNLLKPKFDTSIPLYVLEQEVKSPPTQEVCSRDK
ncbi:hypothetical protein J437_LFUL001363 [Ladona fulva]|uniref:Reverse transcriptase domain-containing protein n=1 Tax=Ladona fulva TaxID=123851 RepID=A0A8K0K1U2_LADFU|nr:hypothetical protein J437_LFUL001363 [Ladona fulva]